MTNQSPSNPQGSPDISSELHRLAMMWGACCISPVLYLGVAWIIKGYFMDQGSGFYPLSADHWAMAVIALVVLLIVLQGVHLIIKQRYQARLFAVLNAPDDFIQLLTRRTLFLISISEMAVFSGFGLFLLQGDPTPVFGAGLVAMFLYAQSHPRSGLPAET